MSGVMSDTRQALFAMFQAGVDAADPSVAVTDALADRPIAKVSGRIILVAVGKAAHGMLNAARAHLPSGTDVQALAVTNYENHREVPGVACFAAGHPVPDDAGLAAGKAVKAALAGAGANDLVIALISGGGSALLPGPVDGISLEDKAEVNRLLLASGADITETNIVRQSLSDFKGGGLLALALPAPLRSLILSDVIGDDLRVIASGPTIGPISDRAGAVEVLKSLGVFDDLPIAVRHVLATEAKTETLPKPDAALVGSNAISLQAMARAATLPAILSEAPLIGNVKAAASRILDEAQALPKGAALLFGGETTVTLTGGGMGGRNQELALRVALEAEKRGISDEWMFLSGGTDGRDGPTDAAGAIVDHTSLTRMRGAGADPAKHLAESDSYHALKASGDLLMTDATGTNVADLQIFTKL